MELGYFGVAPISAAWAEGCAPRLLSSPVDVCRRYIDTDPYSFCSSLNVLLVKYFDYNSPSRLGTRPEYFYYKFCTLHNFKHQSDKTSQSYNDYNVLLFINK